MVQKIVDIFNEMYPDASCELQFNNNYELLVAVMLSAQTTDKAVNKVTPMLFAKYPDIQSLSAATFNEVVMIIKAIGLANMKAKNLIQMAQLVVKNYNGVIPTQKEELTHLAGVGGKTANVYLAVGLGVNAFAVDTHVLRVSNRLGIVDTDNPLVCEKALMKFFAGYDWRKLHHQFIHFGRYKCKAKGMQCQDCQLKIYCKVVREK